MCEAGLGSRVSGMNLTGLNYLLAKHQIADRLAEAEFRRTVGAGSRSGVPRLPGRVLARWRWRRVSVTTSRGPRPRSTRGRGSSLPGSD